MPSLMFVGVAGAVAFHKFNLRQSQWSDIEGASADIACRMAEHNRVENCQIIGENPRGTGLAQALRLAAGQFLVKPPRIDNKPQLGVWVRIHFDFGVKVVEGEEVSP